ncbi:phosphoglycerate mutase-like protein [Wolfiporia cocos MD-104 SS10]|uniref:Phosphoglycerate mutase-like protein n=1 Tax=Wolfiporia cocos (strain MD-104) TaxID=742152 RepID=A0A2H3JTF8_WOLCO|nr:phosphoglycerate mutase-like protein [Wolfiporia cocos MD-104 SS10]
MYTFSIVTGYFAQDDPNANPAVIGALPSHFGLLDDSADRWSKFTTRIAELNGSAPSGTMYKVLFLGRHGQGFHNVAEAKYGTEAWDEYWSKLYGDADIIWGPDPLLTNLGITQAQEARSAWLAEVPSEMPIPDRCYASPLHRALSTWEITFSGGGVFPQGDERVMILENLREEHGVHTCDMRNPLSTIQRNFPPPVHSFEPGFTEDDLIWRPDERETKEHIKARAATVLNIICTNQQDVYISVTAHGGIINGLLAAMGRTSYALPTGGVLPLVVRVESVTGPGSSGE